MAPKSRLARLPKWISFWLGYRDAPVPPQPPYIIWFWSFVGAFGGLAAIQALFGHVPYFINKGVPSIGATAVLIYGAIESPLAQPRPVMGGHLFSAFIGICITKLFLLLPSEERFMELSWLAGALACAVSLVVMQMTGTTHPPAGATALLAAINPDIRRIGWFYIPVVLMASSVALVVALFTNNMQRQYPTFWWKPDPPTPTPFPPSPIDSCCCGSAYCHKNNGNEKRLNGNGKPPMLPVTAFCRTMTMTTVTGGMPTPTDSTVVSRRQSFENLPMPSFKTLEKQLRKHVEGKEKEEWEERERAMGGVVAVGERDVVDPAEEEEEGIVIVMKPGDHNV